MANKHTMSDLYQMQSLPLSVKINMTKRRITEWVSEYGLDGVYVSFSGGKDSTVLLHICRELFPDIKAMFVDVPTQYPELRQFVKTFENVDIVMPKKNFMQVCKEYGFPLISKEVSECVYGARKYLTKILEEESLDKQASKQASYGYYYDKLTGNGAYSKFSESPSSVELLEKANLDSIRGGYRHCYQYETERILGLKGTPKIIDGGTTTSIENSEELASIAKKRGNARLKMMMGVYPSRSGGENREGRSAYSQEKYKFFLDAPFEISNRCCNEMKKNPAHRYHKETGRNPIIATMASESRLRTQKWLENGCNGFNLTIPTSNPMSFWTEQDVLLYIKLNNIPICSVYGDIVYDYESVDMVQGQMTISDIKGFEDCDLFDAQRPPLKTTGCDRTGCVLCGFGCHLEKDGEGRFELLKETHEGLYNLLDVCENNGITYRQAIDWVNEHGNLNIRY